MLIFTIWSNERMHGMQDNKKHPIGIMPKWAYEEKRIFEILEAMKRYSEEDISVPIEWVKELEERVTNLTY